MPEYVNIEDKIEEYNNIFLLTKCAGFQEFENIIF